jgi:hypothetical protein
MGGREREKQMGQICGLYQVDQSTIAIKERCGKFDKVNGPGCHCVPSIIIMLEHLSVCSIPLISLLCCSLSVSLAVSSLYFALSVVSDQSLKLKQWQIHQLSSFLESNHNMDCKECQRGAFDLRCRTMSL